MIREEVVPDIKTSRTMQPAARNSHLPGDNREFRANRERSRRCNTVSPLIEVKEADKQYISHCCTQCSGKAACRAVKPEDLPVADKVTWTDEDSVALFEKSHHGNP